MAETAEKAAATRGTAPVDFFPFLSFFFLQQTRHFFPSLFLSFSSTAHARPPPAHPGRPRDGVESFLIIAILVIAAVVAAGGREPQRLARRGKVEAEIRRNRRGASPPPPLLPVFFPAAAAAIALRDRVLPRCAHRPLEREERRGPEEEGRLSDGLARVHRPGRRGVARAAQQRDAEVAGGVVGGRDLVRPGAPRVRRAVESGQERR